MDLTKSTIGIELGSTRIKAVLLDEAHLPAASGVYEWENKLVDGIWTYSMAEIHSGFQACCADLKRNVKAQYGLELTTVGAIGISGMMHGYLPFDRNWKQLAEFRTWRNTITEKASEALTALFGFKVPQRWSIAHLYQAILNGEAHVKDIAHLTTLSGYIHHRLTGENYLGIGEASGAFPIDSAALSYDEKMIRQFDALTPEMPWKLRDILPEVLPAGVCAGRLTPEGARFLDPEGTLQPGIPVCPCEGDMQTGMTATNSVRVHLGNVSAGTSVNAMVVSDRPLGVHREIDMITTPAGYPVAMVHCNNCTSDINAWAGLFASFAQAIGKPVEKSELFSLLFRKALEGAPDCGGLLSYNYFSGEEITRLNEGRPLFVRAENADFTLENFMRTHLFSALATLKLGLDILTEEEKIRIDRIYAHGGFFKTPGVGQKILSSAVNAPVSVMKTAGEGGPYGMALLAAYMLRREEGETLEDYLDNKVFSDAECNTASASPEDIEGFSAFMRRYKAGFPMEKTATEVLL